MATKQFDAQAHSLYRLDAIRQTNGALPHDVGVRVLVDTNRLTRANAIVAINAIEKILATSSSWPMP